MNRCMRAYFIGAAETAARTAGNIFHNAPTVAEMSIKLCYCYHLAAYGHIKEARAYLLNESDATKAAFESVLEQAERVCSAIDF